MRNMLTYLIVTLAILFAHGTDANVDCPNNWITFRDSCYLFETQKETFAVAQQFCEQHDAHLLHVDDINENRFIRDWLTKLKPNRWWFGLTDNVTEHVWRWIDTDTVATFTDWHPGQPDNGAGRQDCSVYHEGMNFDWDDAFCTGTYYFICEIGYTESGAIIG